jgi:glycosyltransferase involved in cell wall biosynthesis
LAQGRCAVPSGEEKDEQRQEERGLLTTRLRPYGEDAGEFLVSGAGTVQYRKGVDLFIDVARRVLSSESGQNARFAWIGSGFDTERDAAYSVYLQDQIRRAGLTDRMIILPATSEIEHVYALSSALLLTSRLDPLPNVAIDALSEGVPVVCFDKTTGIADLLIEADLGDACVAGYLDSADAAEKVLELIRSQETYRRTCERSKAFASRAFDFDLYATKIKELGLGARIH